MEGTEPWDVSPAASLAYRLPQSWVGPKLPWKLGHAAMHLMAFILTVLGLAAVFNFHNHEKIPNLYSLHSWLGITTVFLFACQVGSLYPPWRSPCCWQLGALFGASRAPAPNSPSAHCLAMALQAHPVESTHLAGWGRWVVPTYPAPALTLHAARLWSQGALG